MPTLAPSSPVETAPGGETNLPAWFCLRSQPKHEHIACAHLTRRLGLEALNPRIRFRRSTRTGPVWVTESLFPNYLFARFDLETRLSQVRYAPGVASVVHFGGKFPAVPDEAIAELRRVLGEKEIHEVPMAGEVGEEVRISGGAFHGLRGVIAQVLPARERVRVLLDFLGRQTCVEVPAAGVVRESARRKLAR